MRRSTGILGGLLAVAFIGAAVAGYNGPSAQTYLAQTWTALQKFTNGDLAILGSSTGYSLVESGLSSSSNQTLTLPTEASDTLVDLTGTQTLTNKTLTSPAITSCTTQGQQMYVNSSGKLAGCPSVPAVGGVMVSGGSSANPVYAVPATYQGGSVSIAPGSTSTEQMGGMAGSITPAVSGIVVICVQGRFTNSATTVDEGATWRISYGTGGAPSANAALTGTQIGVALSSTISTTATAFGDIHQPMPSICSVATGLTIGTTYWLDVSQEAVTNTTTTIVAELAAYEIP